VVVLMAVSMVALCALAGFAVDVGLLYHQHRKQQAVADAAALAGAYDLPGNTGSATSDAQSNASTNGGSTSSISYSTQYLPNDTITVQAKTTAATTFLKIFGISSVNVKATAVARAENLSTASGGAAPFGVINTQPELAGPGCPCFSVSTTLALNKVGPGGFGIINIDGSSGGSGPGTLAGWITGGCSCSTTTPVWLNSDTGAKFNSSQVQNAMDGAIGRTLLFPVYDAISGSGSGLAYHVIGFAGFKVTGWTAKGNNATVSGSFEKVDWTGFGTSDTSTYFGATTSQLVG
jgi:hypothetical protein